MPDSVVSALADLAGTARDIVLYHADHPHDIWTSSTTPGAGVAAAVLLGLREHEPKADILDALAHVIKLVERDDAGVQPSKHASYDWADATQRFAPTRHRLIAVAERSGDREAMLDALRGAVSVIESEAR